MGDRGDRGDRGAEKVRGVKSTCLQPRGYQNQLTSKLTFITDVLYWGVSRTLVVGSGGETSTTFRPRLPNSRKNGPTHYLSTFVTFLT